ncbi:hypothetical protein MARGE09_P2829 [Marinagarivorans cellulosilyticus]|uniref:Probable pectate lyase C n=2 Tax=Marinagarivorans cellulosilyticus TaxID=2721545 RepID=A0AAN2BL07_9GAMM|nr:hypothetical protein MARGE09_P2829 [Marinagarivorans cellulosilyticus]
MRAMLSLLLVLMLLNLLACDGGVARQDEVPSTISSHSSLAAISLSSSSAFATSSTDSSSQPSVYSSSSQSTASVFEEGDVGFCNTLSAAIETEHDGYLGAGYANTQNAIGYGLSWRLDVEHSGVATLSIRYANGGDAARSALLSINSGVDGQYALNFPATAGWNDWLLETRNIQLQQGVNDITLLANTAAGLANIDSITVKAIGVTGVDCAEAPPASPDGETLAFPGAQGFGRFAVGGRGGEVVHVTNLNDSGPGSLRDAISQPNRIVVFDVGGVINIKERLVFKHNQTIAGQTAPGDGISIYGNGTSFSGASNTIVRYIRFRMGKVGSSGKDTVSIAHGNNIIFDHVSLSWGRDGNFDVNPDSGKVISNITLQDSIIAQGLQTHSTGGLMVANGGASIIRSLYIDNHTRNPKARGVLQFVNNVVYHWRVAGYILGDSAANSGTRYDGAMIGNYFISGPETSGAALKSPSAVYHLYAQDNWYDPDKNGQLDGRLLGQGDYGSVTWHTTPSTDYPQVSALSAAEALDYVIEHAGASKARDEVDQFLISELQSWGSAGATISDERVLGLANVVGNIAGGLALLDTDNDGMPDEWEIERGLNPQNAADAMVDSNQNGWVNIEEYINALVQ